MAGVPSYADDNNQPTGIVDPSGMRDDRSYQCMAEVGYGDINSVDANGRCSTMGTKYVFQGVPQIGVTAARIAPGTGNSRR